MKPLQTLSLSAVITLAGLWPAARTASAGDALSPRQKASIEQITSIFENGTTDYRYDYIEDIDDGAGITCGRVGFTVGELLKITELYTKAKGPDAPLAQYLPCLRKMGDDIAKDYSCLFPSVAPERLATPEFKKEGGLIAQADFGKAWALAGSDSVMRKIQDDYVEETYFQPAVLDAKRLGLRTALGLACVYDATIQMNTGPLFAAIQAQFAPAHHGRVKPHVRAEEADWLRLYVTERKKELSVTPVGAATTSRVDALGQLLANRNFDLSLPLEFTYSGEHFKLPAAAN